MFDSVAHKRHDPSMKTRMHKDVPFFALFWNFLHLCLSINCAPQYFLFKICDI